MVDQNAVLDSHHNKLNDLFLLEGKSVMYHFVGYKRAVEKVFFIGNIVFRRQELFHFVNQELLWHLCRWLHLLVDHLFDVFGWWKDRGTVVTVDQCVDEISSHPCPPVSEEVRSAKNTSILEILLLRKYPRFLCRLVINQISNVSQGFDGQTSQENQREHDKELNSNGHGCSEPLWSNIYVGEVAPNEEQNKAEDPSHCGTVVRLKIVDLVIIFIDREK